MQTSPSSWVALKVLGCSAPESSVQVETTSRSSDSLSSYLKIDNLFDETYIAARRPAGLRPGLERTVYLGLTFTL